MFRRNHNRTYDYFEKKTVIFITLSIVLNIKAYKLDHTNTHAVFLERTAKDDDTEIVRDRNYLHFLRPHKLFIAIQNYCFGD